LGTQKEKKKNPFLKTLSLDWWGSEERGEAEKGKKSNKEKTLEITNKLKESDPEITKGREEPHYREG